MKAYITILSLFLVIAANAQDSEKTVNQNTVLSNSELYKQLKSSGELLNGTYTVIDPNEGLEEHVTIQPSVAGQREGECDCWIEPDETYTEANFAANGTDDGSTANIPFNFDFVLYGATYTSMWINTNGTVTFDGADGTFTPTGFPNDDVMLAPFWADVDFGCADCGTLFYKVTPDAVYVNWVEVGYFNEQSDKVNSFQLTFTPVDSEVLANDNTVQFCYLDMQWTTGSASGGSNGFGGSPANVGASAGNNTDFILFGEFDQAGDDYDGPFETTDGVSWLDNQTINFNANISANDNLPPLLVGNVGGDCGDTIVLCANDSELLEFTFLAPENNQEMVITFDDGGFPDIEIETTDGSVASVTAQLNSDVTTGVFNISFTATDDGTPALSTSVDFVVEVIDVVIPDLDITFDGVSVIDDVVSYCQGDPGVTLSGSDGFDSYSWSNGSENQTDDFLFGTYNLEAFFMGCDAQAGPVTVLQIPVFNPPVTVLDNTICSGQTTTVSLQNPANYDTFVWAPQNGNGEIISPDPNVASVEVTPGVYTVTVTDDNLCPGTSFVVVNEEIVNTPDLNFQDVCDDNEISWSGAWADPITCGHLMTLTDSEGDTWESAVVEVYVDGVGPFNYTITSGFPQTLEGVDAYHGQVIDYYFVGGSDDDDIGLTVFDADNNILFETATGDVLTPSDEPFLSQVAQCGFNALEGEWEIISAPDGGEDVSFEFDDVFNPVNGANSLTVPDDIIGTYTIGFNSDVCDTQIEFDVAFNSTPTVEAFDYEACEGTEVLIDPSYGPDNVIEIGELTYNWDPGINALIDGQPTNTVSQTVNYSVEVGNDCGTNEAEGTVTIIPIPNPVLSAESLCDDNSVLLNPIANEHPSFVYNWTGNGITDATLEQQTINASGTINVVVTNECGQGEAVSQITQNFTPTVTAAADLPVCPGEAEVVAPTWSNGVTSASWSYSWVDPEIGYLTNTLENLGTSISFDADQFPLAAQETGVTVHYITSNICGSASDSTYLFIDNCFIGATNVFSPDSDNSDAISLIDGNSNGLNESWYIYGIDGISNVNVQLYNRWGGIVFEDSNYKNSSGWDGKDNNGDDLEDGVYFYIIKVPNRDDVTGSVTILRKP